MGLNQRGLPGTAWWAVGAESHGRCDSLGEKALRVKVLVTQLCLTLCGPMDCSPPGSSAHGILQARTLVWVAMPSSRGSS